MTRAFRRLIAALLALSAALAVAALWLAYRPLPLSFAIPALERALSAPDGRYGVAIGHAALTWGGPELGLTVSAEEVNVLRSDGSLIVSVPRLMVELAGRALLQRQLVVEAIRFEQPVVTLVRATDGRFEVLLGSEPPAQSDATAGAELADGLFELMTAPRDPTQPLRRVTLHEADLGLDDHRSGTLWRARGATLDLHRGIDGVEGTLSLDVLAEGPAEAGVNAPIHVDVSVAARRAGPELELEISAGLPALGVDALQTWWPEAVAGEARAWVLEHIHGGRIEDLAVDALLRMQRKAPREPSLERLRGRFSAKGLSVAYADGWPEATGLEAEATLDADTLRFVLQTGSISELRVEEGEVVLSGLSQQPLRIDVRTQVRGPLASVTQLLEHEPLNVFDRIGIEPGRPAGEAQASVDLSIRPGRKVFLVANDFSLVSPDANARGRFEPSDDGGIHHLRLDPLRVGNNDLRLELGRAKDGEYELELRGAHADLRPWLREGIATPGGPSTGAAPAFRIDAELDALRLTSGKPLRNVRARARRNARGWRSIDFDAAIDSGHGVSVNLLPAGAGSKLDIRCDDLGLLLSSMLDSRHVIGGDLVLEATRSQATAPLEGHFLLTDPTLVEVPGLTKMLQGLSLTGLLSLLRGKGLEFSLWRGDFRYAKGVAELSEVNAVHPSLMLQAAGSLELEGAIADLRGIVVPFENANRLIDKLPVLGGLITGGGKGRLAADFQLQGPLDDPEVNVSALSAITPSALKGLAGFIRQTATDAGTGAGAR